VASALARPALEEIVVPTLIISAEDDLYGTYERSVYTAGQIQHAKLVTFERGGHLLIGHEAEVRSLIRSVLTQPTTDQRRAAARAASQ
jgi:pimeloyl-ACP methyl ester carboxylesterase